MDDRAITAFEEICRVNPDIQVDLTKINNAVSTLDTYIDDATQLYFRFFVVGYRMGRKDSGKVAKEMTEIESVMFFTFHIANNLGVNERKIRSMLERGYFEASVKPGNGHSSTMIYGIADLLKAHFALQLEKMGYSVDFIREKMAGY